MIKHEKDNRDKYDYFCSKFSETLDNLRILGWLLKDLREEEAISSEDYSKFITASQILNKDFIDIFRNYLHELFLESH